MKASPSYRVVANNNCDSIARSLCRVISLAIREASMGSLVVNDSVIFNGVI